MKFQYLLISLTLLSSCSIFKGRSLFGDDEKKETASEQSKSVSKKEYDELAKKYDDLNKRFEQLSGIETSPQMQDDKELLQDESLDLKQKLQMSDVPSEQSGNTVNFKRAMPTKNSASNGIVIKENKPIDIGKIEAEIQTLRKANAQIAKNRFDQALQKLKSLNNSQSKQIQVRAKFSMGEILFKQGEFDLAMQIFEEIINEHAFSGLVLKTLGKIIACSNKLKLKKKEDQYSSILYDFFES